jgi:hypothetical protein
MITQKEHNRAVSPRLCPLRVCLALVRSRARLGPR